MSYTTKKPKGFKSWTKKRRKAWNKAHWRATGGKPHRPVTYQKAASRHANQVRGLIQAIRALEAAEAAAGGQDAFYARIGQSPASRRAIKGMWTAAKKLGITTVNGLTAFKDKHAKALT